MVMTQPQAGGATGGKSTEALSHSLPDRFEGFEASSLFYDMNSHAFSRAVVDGGENGNRSFHFRAGGSGIGPPHPIGSLRDNRSLMRMAAVLLRLTCRGKQMIFPEQSQDAVLRSTNTFVPEPGPNLAVAFSAEYGSLQKLSNLSHEFLIEECAGTSLTRFPLRTVAGSIKTGTRQAPDRQHSRYTIRLVAGRRDGATHGLDLQDAKGRLSSRRAIFSRNSSFSTLMVATTDFKRRFSSSSTSTSRLFRPTSPLARKRSRHSLKVATVTRCLREVLSKSAPRNNSKMTDTLRLAPHRPAPGSGPDSGDCSVALPAPSAAPESTFFVLDMFSPQNSLY
jgi:hypothetical protein